MSVFVYDALEEGVNRSTKTKKKYYTKYSVKYKEEYPWALPSSKGDLHAFCHFCYVDISIKTVGAKGLRDHEATCRHSQKAHQMGLKPIATVPNSDHQRVGLTPNLNCAGNGHGSSSSLHNLSTVEIIFANPVSGYPHLPPQPPTPSQNFIHPTVMRGQHQLCSPIAQSSLLSSNQPPSLPSSIYPVLEVEEREDHPNCRSPQTPQTPNTPSNPLTQDHFNPLGNKLISATTNPLVDLQRDLQCSMSEDLASTQGPFHCHSSSKPTTNIATNHHLQTVDCLQKSNQIASGYNEHSNNDQTQSDLSSFSSPIIANTFLSNKNDPKRKSNDNAVENKHSNYTENPSNTGVTMNKRGPSSPSVEDLTCNICGEIFLDWKDLKKDLMEHIKDAKKASNSKSSSPVLKQDSIIKKRDNRQTREKKTPESPIKEPEIILKRKRGRPPGRKKKSDAGFANVNSNCVDGHVSNIGNHQVSSFGNKEEVRALKKRGRPSKNVKSAVDIEKGNSKFEGNFALAGSLSSVAEEEFCDGVLEICQQQLVEDSSQERAVEVGVRRNESVPNRRSGQLQCRVCRAIFYLRQELKDHYQLEHNNGRPYECDDCHKFFTTKNNLEIHKRHKHTQGPNPCLCSICGKLLSSRTNLKIHMMIHKGERPYCCPVCNKEFSRKANMEMHMVYHTGERRFTCEICGQSFFAINALKRHKKLHTGERDFACEVCGATYVTGTDLRRHRLKHDDIKPFPCTICEKQFTRSHDLKVHMRYHNKEHRFTCNICSKQFVESGNYRRHMRRHTGERPYICNFCLQTFSQVHHYKVHLKTNHPENQPENMADMVTTRGRTQIDKKLQQNSKVNSVKRSPKPTHNHSTIAGHHSSVNGCVVTTVGSLNNSIQDIHNVHINNVSSHNHAPISAITSISTVGNMGEIHHNHSATGAPPIAHTGNVSGVMMPHHSQVNNTAGTNHPTSGFLQTYNSYIYNPTVIPQYQTLFDICPQQSSANHLGTH